MVLSKFYRQTTRNVSGNQYLFLAEAANIYDIVVTDGEVSQIIMDLDYKFEGIEVDKNSVKRLQSGKRTNKSFTNYEHSINFRVSEARKEMNVLSGELSDLAACGVAAIIQDENGRCWLTGWSQSEEVARPLYLDTENFDSGENAGELSGANAYQLKGRNDEKDLPLDSTLNSYVQTQIDNAMGLGTGIGLGFTRGGGGVVLDIAYTATQFDFKFKLPSTKTVTIDWGDGNTEDVVGQDAAEITKTSNYSGAATYSFQVSGDADEITYINIRGQAFVSGDISGWSTLTNLDLVQADNTNVSGDISGWSALTNLTYIQVNSTSVSGDISGWITLVNCTVFYIMNTNLSGDISGWAALTGITILQVYSTNVTFDGTDAWTNASATIEFHNCGWTTTMVNNFIEAAKTCTNSIMNVAGTNDHRTAASNDDLNTLYANGNSITLNDTLGAHLHTSLNAANDQATQAVTAFSDYASTIDGATKVETGAFDLMNAIPQGAENVPDPGFDSALGVDWNHTANWAIGSSQATVTGGTGLLYDSVLATIGKYYVVGYEVISNNVAGGSLRLNGAGGYLVESDLALTDTVGAHKVVVRAFGPAIGFQLSGWSSGSLVLDNISVKELLVVGSDLATNGDFSAAGTWVYGNNWTYNAGTDMADATGAQSGEFLYQDAGITANDTFLIKFEVKNYASGIVECNYGGSGVITEANSDGEHSVLATAGAAANGNLVFLGKVGNDFTGSIDNVTVHKLILQKEIAASTNYTGDHYILPVDENDFIIPVAYAAEPIVAQLFTGESNAVAGWTQVGLDAGANVFESQESVVDVGKFAIHADSNDTPANYNRFWKDIQTDMSISNGDVVRISFRSRHIGSGGTWASFLGVGSSASTHIIKTLDNTEITYVESVYYWVHDADHRYFGIRETSSSNNGGVYLDDIKVQKVTFP